MGGVEHVAFFYSQRRQGVYIEKAAIIELFISYFPMRQPVVLSFQQYF